MTARLLASILAISDALGTSASRARMRIEEPSVCRRRRLLPTPLLDAPVGAPPDTRPFPPPITAGR